MAGNPIERIAPKGARLAASAKRPNDRLSAEEMASLRRGAAATAALPVVPEDEDEPALASRDAAPVTPPSLEMPTILPPYAVAEMCERAGMAELTAGMLHQPMTAKQVEGRLEEARLTLQAGRLCGLQSLGRSLMTSGISLASARAVLNEAQVSADEAIGTDAGHSGLNSSPKATTGMDPRVVYERLNQSQRGGAKGHTR